MYDKTKKILLATSCGSALLLGSCLVLNEAGLQPVDSVEGSRIDSLLQGGGGVAYQFGVTNYCASRGDATACANAIGDDRIAVGTLLAGMTLAASVPYDPDETYTGRSVRACRETAGFETTLLTQSYLANAASGNDSAGVGPGDLTAAALIAASYAGARCDLEPTGRVVSIGELNL